jgi:pimeloyl-ACP methyl ester carboxylesterase
VAQPIAICALDTSASCANDRFGPGWSGDRDGEEGNIDGEPEHEMNVPEQDEQYRRQQTVLASDLIIWAMVRLAPNFLVRIAGVPPSLNDEVTPEFRNDLVDGFFPASARHVGLAHDIRTTTPTAPNLPIEQLQMPVLLLSAADEPYKTADIVRYSAPRIPDARAVILETGGHVMIGQNQRVRQEVQSFLHDHVTSAE